MKHLNILGGGLLLLTLPALGAGPDHLVLSEIANRGGLYNSSHQSSEFTEIYNPTGSSITDLENYYITDWALYHTLPTATRDGLLPDLGTGDNLSHFPETALDVPAGGVVVVTANGTYFLDAFFGGSLAAFQAQPGSPQLFEMFNSSESIPDMVDLNQETTDDGKNISHADAGENQFLFYWDGATDLVKDVDMMMYAGVGDNLGYSNGFTVKTDLVSDGPDLDVIESNYAADNGSTANLTARYLNTPTGESPFQYARRSLIEVGEATTGGNGLTGHDESLEEINYTWGGLAETTATATPGVTALGLSSADQPPVIYNAIRVEAFPQEGQTINFQANIADDASVASAILKVDIGGGFTDVAMINSGPGDLWTASITAPVNGTEVKWYVSATDSGSQTRTSNDYQFFSAQYLGYEAFEVGSPIVNDGDLQFTEIHYDTVGGDNHGESEFVEVHNTTNAAIDMSGFAYGKNLDDIAVQMIIPEGTVIGPHGFLILAAKKPLFLLNYPGFDPALVVEVPWQVESTLTNGSTRISIIHPNQIGTNGQSSTPTDDFTYSGMTAGTGAGNTGFTFELKDMDGPNDDQAAWDVSLVEGGTPGRDNTVANPGNMAIANQGRTVQFPQASTPIVINADVTGTNSISAVNLHYTTTPGLTYTETPMSLVSGAQYTKDLGTFPSGTIVKYFIEAVDSTGQVRTYPPFAAPIVFHVDDNPATSADLVITELMPDPTNAENVDFSEWFEIHNRRGTEINLSFFKTGHITAENPYPRVLPEGTTIPGNGYLVFAGNQDAFLAQYTTVDTGRVFHALYNGSVIGNASGSAYITHANAINWNELTWQGSGTPMDVVPYFDNANGWPNVTNNITYELLDVTSDNSMSENWGASLPGGTPAAANRNANVSDWSMY